LVTTEEKAWKTLSQEKARKDLSGKSTEKPQSGKGTEKPVRKKHGKPSFSQTNGICGGTELSQLQPCWLFYVCCFVTHRIISTIPSI
jgi:hypothetical protein